jgi:hypothetical protein
MPLESAQMLSTIAASKGHKTQYKPVHHKHPATLWVGKSSANWNWLCEHGLGLCSEYTNRYSKIHKSEEIIREFYNKTKDIFSDNVSSKNHTEFAQCMPDAYKTENAVLSYRLFYIYDKAKFATWKSPSLTPDWFKLKNKFDDKLYENSI